MNHFLIRYGGSKAKLYGVINQVIPDDLDGLYAGKWTCYCEPFFGSGAIGMRVLGAISRSAHMRPRVIINDADLYIARLWNAILHAPRQLADMVIENTPEAADFARYKKLDGREGVDPVVSAYRKLVLHNTSFSGLGAMAGSAIGGKNPTPKYNHLVRWNPVRMSRTILAYHGILSLFRGRIQIRHGDFQPALESVPDGGFAYLDPPYYQQGAALYKHNMDDDAHVRLSEVLRRANYRFLLSYDGHDRIRHLYQWANVRSFEMTPTISISKKKRRKNDELLITNY